MFHSFRWRIAFPYILLLLLTLLGLGIFVSTSVRQAYLAHMEAELTAEARLVAQDVAEAVQTGAGPQELNELAQQTAAILDRRITILDAVGNVIGDSHEAAGQMENHLERPEIQLARRRGVGINTRFSDTLGVEMMNAAVPLPSLPGAGGEAGFVRVALPLEQIQGLINQLLGAFTGLLLVVTILSVMIAAWIASRTTSSLEQLTVAVRQVPTGNLDQVISPSPDEFGQLNQAFHQMAVRLRSQIEDIETERSKLAAVLSQMTDGVVIVSPRGEVQLFNPAAEQIFGVAYDRAIGRSLAEALRTHQFVDLWQRCLQTGETVSASIEIASRRFYLHAVATPLGEALPGSILLLFQDLTHLRRLETVRRDFISNISHELRTPLASLKALTETLQEGALDDPPMALHFLQRMETEVDALSLMVSELLDLSRIESGRLPLQMEAVDPQQIIEIAASRLTLQAERAGLVMTVECEADLPPILADPPRLEQVMVNLLQNAINFTPAGGKIHIRLVRSSSDVLFSVQDTGVGIPANELPRIFERFYKADPARTRGGVGLGLAIARHMIEAHGGKIWVESQSGRGSIFFFTIPQAN